MPKMMKYAILFDFDDTITTINVLDTLYEMFGGPSTRYHMERWRLGEISTMEELDQIFDTVKSTREEMEAFLRTVELDPGFKALLAFCQELDYPFAIVSDGLRWYIDFILNSHGVEGIKVYAGEIIFLEKGFRFEFPWYDPAFPLRSTAKPTIVKDYQSQGYEVVFVGDGLSDVEAAEVADVVYAKDVLLREARERGIGFREFEELQDVYRDLSPY